MTHPKAVRTSISHPLRIAELRVLPNYGRIGITFCPGKFDETLGGRWQRDLELDLDAIRDWDASAVVTLIEHHEFAALRVKNLEQLVRDRKMEWYHLPIEDFSPPGESFEAAWSKAGGELRSRLRNGLDIVVHCKGGLGRSGTLAAKLLVELGMEPIKATEEVRRARPGAIETKSQEEYVLRQQPASA